MLIIDEIIRKELLYESLGINSDVLTLSFLIKQKITNGENEFIINGSDINNRLKLLKINKLHINFKNDPENSIGGYVIPDKTKNTSKGIISFIVLNVNDIDVISHELNHVIQSQYVSLESKIKNQNDLSLSFKVNREHYGYNKNKIDEFLTYLYRLTDHEIDSYVYNTTINLCKLLPKNFTNNQFRYFLKQDKSFIFSKDSINFNINEFKNDINEDYLKLVYSRFLNLDKLEPKTDNIINRFITHIKYFINDIKYSNSYHVDTDDYIQFFNKWGKWINKQGEKLNRKLVRIYDVVKTIQEEYDIYSPQIESILNKIENNKPLSNDELLTITLIKGMIKNNTK